MRLWSPVVRLLGRESAATTLTHCMGRFATDLDDIDFPTRRSGVIDYRQPRCVIGCQFITDQGTDQNKPRPVGGQLKTIADLHKQRVPRQESSLRPRL